MFSWIIESKWRINNIKWKIFEINCDFEDKLKIWQSISHDWVCLTVIKAVSSNVIASKTKQSSTLNKLKHWEEKDNEDISEWHDKIMLQLYEVEVMPETLSRTNLWEKKVWDYVNLERSLKIGDRLDWHMVQGHVDCVWILEKIEDQENSKILTISFPKEYSNYFVEKWSISLNWISLTIISAYDDFLTVWIIPHTWEVTNLSNLKNLKQD